MGVLKFDARRRVCQVPSRVEIVVARFVIQRGKRPDLEGVKFSCFTQWFCIADRWWLAVRAAYRA